MLVFEERGKPEYPEKNLSEQSREPTNSAHLWRRVRESNPGHIGGRRAPRVSPLRQPCSSKWILDSDFSVKHSRRLFERRGPDICWKKTLRYFPREGNLDRLKKYFVRTHLNLKQEFVVVLHRKRSTCHCYTRVIHPFLNFVLCNWLPCGHEAHIRETSFASALAAKKPS